MNTFSKVMKESSALNEHNDCSVKAIAIACDVPYKVAHKALANLGRRERRGVFNHTIYSAINQLGFSMECVKVKAKTTATLPNDPAVQEGFYVVFVSGHVAALVNGNIEDWTKGRRNRVKIVFKITPNKTRAERKAIMKQLFI